MKRKLLGLAAALGITVLASWATPVLAELGPCTGRYCGSNKELQCACLPGTHHAGQVFSCQAWLQSNATACN